MRFVLPSVVLLLATLLAGTAHALASEARERGHGLQASPSSAASWNWWDRFGEPALGSLQRIARVRAMREGSAASARPTPWDTEAIVANAFVDARILELRLLLTDRRRMTLLRQRALMSATAPGLSAGEALDALDVRLAAMTQARDALAARQSVSFGTISGLTGISPALVRDIVDGGAQAAVLPTIPVFTADPDAAGDAPASVLVLEERLHAQLQSVREHEVQLDAAARRWNAGTTTENELLVANARLLEAEDRLAVVGGDLARAWIDIHQQEQATVAAARGLGHEDSSLRDTGVAR